MKKRGQFVARLRLRPQERAALRRLLRAGHTGIWLAYRVQAVLLAARGDSMASIARRLGRDRKWVRDWVSRFGRLRLDGLHDKQRSGRPAKFSPGGAA